MYSKKKCIFITTVMITMLLGITGCGKSTEEADQAGKSAVTAEDLPMSEERDNGAVPEAEDMQGKNPEGGDGEQAASQDTELFSDLTGDGENVPGSAQGESTFHYINEDKDLYGDIWEVGEGKFTVTEIYNEKMEDGSQIMTSLAEGAAGEAPKITVTYDENTKFIRQTIRDGGASHEEKEASAADLEKGLTAEMNGSYEGDVFHATEILIVEVILD